MRGKRCAWVIAVYQDRIGLTFQPHGEPASAWMDVDLDREQAARFALKLTEALLGAQGGRLTVAPKSSREWP